MIERFNLHARPDVLAHANTSFKVLTSYIDGSMLEPEPYDAIALLEQLRPLLNAGPACFIYQTTKGELRRAIGTLSPELIPSKSYAEIREMGIYLKVLADGLEDSFLLDQIEDKELIVASIKKHCKGLGIFPNEEPKKAKAVAPGNFNYYDLGKKAWRSFNEDNLVAILNWL